MDSVLAFGTAVYVYCTDFMINLANLTSTSYYEVNLVLFGIVYPALIVSSLVCFLIQNVRWARAKKVRVD